KKDGEIYGNDNKLKARHWLKFPVLVKGQMTMNASRPVRMLKVRHALPASTFPFVALTLRAGRVKYMRRKSCMLPEQKRL
ncbi:MAG TPA: hypothetical protein VK064_00305, partial [Wenzhouxiangella sp.]|nr:hypothetical protein [Wenzhouxiangella sp.]